MLPPQSDDDVRSDAPSPHSDPVLRALVDTFVPRDEYASGTDADTDRFVAAVLTGERRSVAPLVARGLRLLDEEAKAREGAGFGALGEERRTGLVTDLLAGRVVTAWGDVPPAAFAEAVLRLTVQGYYGDPGSGGNRDAVSWAMVRYEPVPEGASWPPVPPSPVGPTPWDEVAHAYTAVVVGAGAGGGVAACVLAEAGHRVLLVERGPWLDATALRPDHLRNQRPISTTTGDYDTPAGPPREGNPRVLETPDGDLVVWPNDARYSNNAMTLGGGTRVFGAQAWRFCPEDFRMASTYGVPAGSSLADWPVSYEDMEPWYARAEQELGVSGDPRGNAYAGPRARGYPMPPVRPNAVAGVLATGAEHLGWRTSPVPLLINSIPYGGRGACIGCGACVGFGCPGEFKNGTHNTVIPRALATGRCDLVTGAQAERILVDRQGRVRGVALVTDRDSRVERREVQADHVVLAAGAVETARLLLASASEQEPTGLGNRTDQVGRNMQGHVYSGAYGVFADDVVDCRGPGPSISTNDFRHGVPGLIGGGMLANDFVLTPLQAYAALSENGFVPTWGRAGKRGMAELYRRLVLVTGPIQEVPDPACRVTVDPNVRDWFGMPVARLRGTTRPEDRRGAEFLADRADEWLRASGAVDIVRKVGRLPVGPSGGQHQAGTCRMGTSPRDSVTDEWGTVWGHDNLHVADASLHVTNGGVNPVLTVLALAYRVSDHVARLASGSQR